MEDPAWFYLKNWAAISWSFGMFWFGVAAASKFIKPDMDKLMKYIAKDLKEEGAIRDGNVWHIPSSFFKKHGALDE